MSASESEHRCILLLRVVGGVEKGECDSKNTDTKKQQMCSGISESVPRVLKVLSSPSSHPFIFSVIQASGGKSEDPLFSKTEREESLNSEPLPGSSIDVQG